jgi:hypothetical protein
MDLKIIGIKPVSQLSFWDRPKLAKSIYFAGLITGE